MMLRNADPKNDAVTITSTKAASSTFEYRFECILITVENQSDEERRSINYQESSVVCYRVCILYVVVLSVDVGGGEYDTYIFTYKYILLKLPHELILKIN